MLVFMESQRLYEVVSFYSKNTEKYILVVNTEIFSHLPDEKKQQVKEFYADILPEDELGEIFAEQYRFYEFPSQTVAIETATDWFPRNLDLDDQDYFVECYVITPKGGIPYTNKVTPRPEG